jgi:hypothetical protein
MSTPQGADPLGNLPWASDIRTVSQRDQERQQKAESAKAEALIEKFNREKAEREAARERVQIERGQADLEAERQRRLAAWTHAGGTEADFNRAWPDLRVEYLKGKTATSAADELYERMKAAGPLAPEGTP